MRNIITENIITEAFMIILTPILGMTAIVIAYNYDCKQNKPLALRNLRAKN